MRLCLSGPLTSRRQRRPAAVPASFSPRGPSRRGQQVRSADGNAFGDCPESGRARCEEKENGKLAYEESILLRRRITVKILLLNRRDIANPAGGGAEIYTHEIARGLVGKYHCECVVFASLFPGSASEEVIDGVTYVRRGNEATVHLRGFIYAVKNRKKVELIIDEFNGIGFFTFFLTNSILLIHQLYREFWFRELGGIGIFPYLLEPLLLRFYRKRLAITVSISTKKDLERLGFRRIKIVMNAIRSRAAGTMRRNAEPTLVFLGRLKRTKQPGDAIKIFREVKRNVAATRLWMIGAGPLEGELKKQAEGLAGVTFWGYVDENKKMSLLQSAHVLIVPSVREGFGINVIEAASAGCPAVGYDVPGLRDSIRHSETGYLVASADEAAVRIIGLLSNQDEFQRMSTNCRSFAAGFDWEKRVDEFWDAIKSPAR
jgi:glycosyltransferase involved in cell wall biosynthesis